MFKKNIISDHSALLARPALFLLAASLLLFESVMPVRAADYKPPLQELRHPNYTLIVAERTAREVEEGKMAFTVLERLKGDPDVPDEVELLVLSRDADYIEIGKRYLVFYSDVERVNFKARTQARRPDRRQLIHVQGADPAVFPDTPAMRTLLTPGHTEIERDPQYAAIVLQGLRSDDPQMVDLWSAEWALRPGSFPVVKKEQVELFSEIVADPRQRPAARARILQGGAERTPEDLGYWFVDSANHVLGKLQPAQLHENTGLSQLIYASLYIVREFPDDSNATPLEKWLKAAPPLAESAALALRAINPKLERQAVVAAIEDTGTPEQTRTFLQDHLRRLDLLEQRT